MSRRRVLAGLGVGVAGLALGPRSRLLAQTVASDRVLDLARRIREVPRSKLFELVTDVIGRGATPDDLLASTFLAGVEDVRPYPVGNNLHSVMVVEAAFRLVATAGSPVEAWQTALWTADSFKDTQHERGESWVLPPAPSVSFPNEATARRELQTALETWDPERADRAIVGLIPFHHRDSIYEVLWPYAARCLEHIGHKIVYTAMTEAVLRRVEWRHAQPALRSLAEALVSSGRRAPADRAWQHGKTLLDRFPSGWQGQRGGNAEDSSPLLRILLTGTYREAQSAAVEALRAGMSPNVVWDAARLGAADLWLRRESQDPESGEAIRSAHTVTEMWSLGHAWRASKDDRNRKILLLQAAAWIPEMRDALLERDAIAMSNPGLEALEVSARQLPTADLPHDLDTVLAEGDPKLTLAWLTHRSERTPALIRGLRNHLPSKGVEYHQHKVAVALEDEVAVSAERWAPAIVAPTLGYLPTAASPDNALADRTRRALGAAGLATG